jgi:hypothetical protein
MSQLPAHEILGAIFGVIIRAAEKDPAFAQELMGALSGGIHENSSTGGQKSRLRRLFDPSGFHAINILRAHGEDALRGKLEQVRATADLRSVAIFSGLVLSGRASNSRATREDLIDGIVAAAKHYVAQRDVAAS